MSIDREIWKEWFTLNDFNSIPCPICKKGTLTANDKNIYQKETEKSKKSVDPNWGPDPYDYEGRFYASLKCIRCNDHFHVIGKSAYYEVYTTDSDGNPDRDFKLIYSPISFYPAPQLINLNDDIPNVITDELKIAFSLFWQDCSASGNRIRVAVEKILDSFDIPRFNKNKKVIMLHSRIEEFKIRVSKYGHLSDQLMAIKWLGNEASHTAGLTRIDIFDALDLLEFVLEELFHGRKIKMQKLAKKINKKKGSIYTK